MCYKHNCYVLKLINLMMCALISMIFCAFINLIGLTHKDIWIYANFILQKGKNLWAVHLTQNVEAEM